MPLECIAEVGKQQLPQLRLQKKESLMKTGWKWLCQFLRLAFADGARAPQMYLNEIYTRGTSAHPDWIE